MNLLPKDREGAVNRVLLSRFNNSKSVDFLRMKTDESLENFTERKIPKLDSFSFDENLVKDGAEMGYRIRRIDGNIYREIISLPVAPDFSFNKNSLNTFFLCYAHEEAHGLFFDMLPANLLDVLLEKKSKATKPIYRRLHNLNETFALFVKELYRGERGIYRGITQDYGCEREYEALSKSHDSDKWKGMRKELETFIGNIKR
jgi:hypothetical protein